MRKRISISIMLLVVFVVIPVCFAQEEADLGRPSAAAKSASASQEYDKEIEQQIKQAQANIKYTSSGLRDPFSLTLPQETPVIEAGPMPEFKIEGYIWGSNIPQAIIEGAVYGEGDTVKGAKIIKIDKSGITLFYNGNNYIVK